MELSEAASDISSVSSPAGVPACLTSPVENSDCTSAVSSRSRSRHGRGHPSANSDAAASSSVADDDSSDAELASVPQDPQPSQQPSAASPMSPMKRLCTTLVESIPHQHLPMLRRNLECLAILQGCGLLTAGSACSGTDLFFPALVMFTHIACGFFGIANVEWSNTWACELEPMKQTWLKTVMQVEHVVADIHDLATGGWRRLSDGSSWLIEEVFLFFSAASHASP